MAKFKYVGDPNDKFSGPDRIEQYGRVFIKNGDAVEMPEKTDDDKYNVKILQGHTHFVDVSDKDQAKSVADQQKALEAADKAKEKANEEQRKKDEADEKKRQDAMKKDLAKRGGEATAENAPRPPGTVTRLGANKPFQGRTVEERTPAEDHTKAGKTKS